MFDAKDEVQQAVESLWSIGLKYDRGSMIPWSAIEKLAGRRFDNRARHVIGRFRRRLRKERRIVTRVAIDTGIRLLTHKEAAREVPEDRGRRAYRQVNRGLKETATIDDSFLSDHERRTLVQQRQHLRFERLQIGRAVREQKKAMTATEVNPQRPVREMAVA